MNEKPEKNYILEPESDPLSINDVVEPEPERGSLSINDFVQPELGLLSVYAPGFFTINYVKSVVGWMKPSSNTIGGALGTAVKGLVGTPVLVVGTFWSMAADSLAVMGIYAYKAGAGIYNIGNNIINKPEPNMEYSKGIDNSQVYNKTSFEEKGENQQKEEQSNQTETDGYHPDANEFGEPIEEVNDSEVSNEEPSAETIENQDYSIEDVEVDTDGYHSDTDEPPECTEGVSYQDGNATSPVEQEENQQNTDQNEQDYDYEAQNNEAQCVAVSDEPPECTEGVSYQDGNEVSEADSDSNGQESELANEQDYRASYPESEPSSESSSSPSPTGEPETNSESSDGPS